MKNILKGKRGEGYIDTVVVVLAAVMVLALAVQVFPVFIAKGQLDSYAQELCREAEITGRVGTETSNRQRVLSEKLGIHPTVTWSKTGNIQLN